ncbi:MAG: hypothetical protein WBK76_02390 [Candidatus Saccharimonadales bacterium]
MKANIKKRPGQIKRMSDSAEPSAVLQTERDFKDALLTVSIFANLFMLCVWVALQATTQYDAALANFFLNR